MSCSTVSLQYVEVEVVSSRCNGGFFMISRVGTCFAPRIFAAQLVAATLLGCTTLMNIHTILV